MPADTTGDLARLLHARYPGSLQTLYAPHKWWTPWRDYALDNGAFGAWKNGQPFKEAAFVKLCDRALASKIQPRWVVCPDVVGDWPATLQSWSRWAPRLRHDYGWPVALAVQDGATVEDVKAYTDPALIFVGGSTRFKWRTFRVWCASLTRVHVGRVNRVEWAQDCAKAGVESIDGTGWMRTTRQRKGLIRLLEWLRHRETHDLGIRAA